MRSERGSLSGASAGRSAASLGLIFACCYPRPALGRLFAVSANELPFGDPAFHRLRLATWLGY